MITNGKSIGIIGGGAVGSILAAHLTKIGQDTIIVESEPNRHRQIEQDGLKIKNVAEIEIKPGLLLKDIRELKKHSLLALFICTKTWSLKQLLPELAKSIRPNTKIVSFQNGIGPEDEVGKYFSAEDVSRGVVNFAGGVNRETGDVTMAWFNPPNILGPLSDIPLSLLQPIADIMNEAGLTTVVASNHEVKKKAFFKTILNSALNALCANSGITMKNAMTYKHTRHLAQLLIREGLSVASAVGYTYGEDSVEICMEYLDKGGDHLPSMWSDLVSKAPTEIEYINGKIAKIGMMFKNIDVDVNLFFTSLMITEEIKSGVRDPEDIPDYLTRF